MSSLLRLKFVNIFDIKTVDICCFIGAVYHYDGNRRQIVDSYQFRDEAVSNFKFIW